MHPGHGADELTVVVGPLGARVGRACVDVESVRVPSGSCLLGARSEDEPIEDDSSLGVRESRDAKEPVDGLFSEGEDRFVPAEKVSYVEVSERRGQTSSGGSSERLGR